VLPVPRVSPRDQAASRLPSDAIVGLIMRNVHEIRAG
jgi:hypothetical protein